VKQYVEKNRKIFYFDSKEYHAPYDFGNTLLNLLETNQYHDKNLVFLCIGSDRATGDCLGPLLGYKLSSYARHKYAVYGTLEQPVHAKNLKETMDKIYSENSNPLVIAIDASLGKASHVGYFTLGEGPLKPGAGVDKDLPYVGDLFVTGIVNLSGLFDQMLLQTTRLSTVMSLVDHIYQGINHCLIKLSRNMM
jgi:putative sporulation protein YyaC